MTAAPPSCSSAIKNLPANVVSKFINCLEYTDVLNLFSSGCVAEQGEKGILWCEWLRNRFGACNVLCAALLNGPTFNDQPPLDKYEEVFLTGNELGASVAVQACHVLPGLTQDWTDTMMESLRIAVLKDRWDVLRELAHAGVYTNAPLETRKMFENLYVEALKFASGRMMTRSLETMLKEVHFLHRSKDVLANDLLCCAAFNGLQETVECLLEVGADPRCYDDAPLVNASASPKTVAASLITISLFRKAPSMTPGTRDGVCLLNALNVACGDVDRGSALSTGSPSPCSSSTEKRVRMLETLLSVADKRHHDLPHQGYAFSSKTIDTALHSAIAKGIADVFLVFMKHDFPRSRVRAFNDALLLRSVWTLRDTVPVCRSSAFRVLRNLVQDASADMWSRNAAPIWTVAQYLESLSSSTLNGVSPSSSSFSVEIDLVCFLSDLGCFDRPEKLPMTVRFMFVKSLINPKILNCAAFRRDPRQKTVMGALQSLLAGQEFDDLHTLEQILFHCRSVFEFGVTPRAFSCLRSKYDSRSSSSIAADSEKATTNLLKYELRCAISQRNKKWVESLAGKATYRSDLEECVEHAYQNAMARVRNDRRERFYACGPDDTLNQIKTEIDILSHLSKHIYLKPGTLKRLLHCCVERVITVHQCEKTATGAIAQALLNKRTDASAALSITDVLRIMSTALESLNGNKSKADDFIFSGLEQLLHIPPFFESQPEERRKNAATCVVFLCLKGLPKAATLMARELNLDVNDLRAPLILTPMSRGGDWQDNTKKNSHPVLVALVEHLEGDAKRYELARKSLSRCSSMWGDSTNLLTWLIILKTRCKRLKCRGIPISVFRALVNLLGADPTQDDGAFARAVDFYCICRSRLDGYAHDSSYTDLMAISRSTGGAK